MSKHTTHSNDASSAEQRQQQMDAAAVSETDRLITRMVDGRASDAERTRFELLAGAQPELWRELAMAHQDEVLVARQFERDGGSAAAETDVHHRSAFGGARPTWMTAVTGWAAMILVAAAWLGTALVQEQRADQPGGTMVTGMLSPEDHYAQYRNAPYVLSEMEPEIIDVEPLSDDRVAVRFVRRIEEVAFLDPNQPLPVEEDGSLTRDPKRLRSAEAGPERAKGEGSTSKTDGASIAAPGRRPAPDEGGHGA